MADTQQTIQNFYRVVTERDFTRKFNFRVININAGDSSTQVWNEDDLVYVRTASVPGREITEVTVPYMGLDFHIPGSAKYTGSDAYSMEFYCDRNSQLYQKFQDWTRDVFDDITSTGNYFAAKQTAVIDLVQLDNQLNRVAQYQLVGVSPRQLGPLEYDLTNNGEFVTFTVTVAYQYFRRTYQS
jgi:hypothetical protein